MNLSNNNASAKSSHQKNNINKKNYANRSFDACENNNQNKSKCKIIGGFKIGEIIGQGSFAKVSSATHLITKEKV